MTAPKDIHKFQTLMRQGAGLSALEEHTPLEREELGGKPQMDMEALLRVLAQIRFAKVQSYGESRYHVTDANFDLAMCYSDLHRKMIRLRERIFPTQPHSDAVKETILDTAVDLAGYSVMLLQIIYLLWQMGELEL